MYVNLAGDKAESGKVFLRARGHPFRRGKTDKFTVQTVDVGRLVSLTVGHDNARTAAEPGGPNWFLDSVTVTVGDPRPPTVDLTVETPGAEGALMRPGGATRLKLSTATLSGVAVGGAAVEVKWHLKRGGGDGGDAWPYYGRRALRAIKSLPGEYVTPPPDDDEDSFACTEASPCRSWCSVRYRTSDDRSRRVVYSVDRSSSSTKR